MPVLEIFCQAIFQKYQFLCFLGAFYPKMNVDITSWTYHTPDEPLFSKTGLQISKSQAFYVTNPLYHSGILYTTIIFLLI